MIIFFFFLFSSRRRHTRCSRDWSSDVCSSDLDGGALLVGGNDETAGLVVLRGPGKGAVRREFELGEPQAPAAIGGDTGAEGLVGDRLDRQPERESPFHFTVKMPAARERRHVVRREGLYAHAYPHRNGQIAPLSLYNNVPQAPLSTIFAAGQSKSAGATSLPSVRCKPIAGSSSRWEPPPRPAPRSAPARARSSTCITTCSRPRSPITCAASCQSSRCRVRSARLRRWTWVARPAPSSPIQLPKRSACRRTRSRR